MSRTRKTTAKNLPIPADTVIDKRRPPTADEREEETNTDGPAGFDPELADGFEEADDTTVNRGSHPPQPSTSRRISPTLMKIFQRRRKEIGLSIEQLARLTGVTVEELSRFENTQGQHRLVYDHAIVVARILGIKPSEMPGLRGKEGPPDFALMVAQLERALLAGPMLVYEGSKGERFGGPLERAMVAPSFGLQLADSTLGEGWPKGALLGFVSDAAPRTGDVVIARNRRSKQLALRRLKPPSWAPIADWQPAYPTGGDWVPLARLNVLLPRR